MSEQLESRHFFRYQDTVENLSGERARVVESSALYARLRWEDEREEEVEQFDFRYSVIERAGSLGK